MAALGELARFADEHTEIGRRSGFAVTCPSEAAAIGFLSNHSNACLTRMPSSAVITSSISTKGRFHVVLQPRQRLRVRLWQQLDPRRKQLAQLHVGRAHSLEIGGERLGLGLLILRTIAVRADQFVSTDAFDEIASPILDQQFGQIRVARGVPAVQQRHS